MLRTVSEAKRGPLQNTCWWYPDILVVVAVTCQTNPSKTVLPGRQNGLQPDNTSTHFIGLESLRA
jgi:hypothetical protein